VSQDTHAPSAATGDSVSVRALTAPTRSEIEALAQIFDQYRAHYGEASDASRSARWLEQNVSTGRLRVFIAEDRGRFVGFAITMEIPASLRLARYWQMRDLFVLPAHRRLGVGRALLAPSERLQSRRARCAWSCRPRTTTTPLSVSTPTAATPRSRAIAH
jgi:GNAT superfamily N-acetyltransferase